MAFVAGVSTPAEAALITGEINIGAAPGGGGVQATGGSAWATATGLNFVQASVGPYAGFEGAVTSTTGDFNSVLAFGVNLTDFNFADASVIPLWQIGGNSFDLTSFSVTQSATEVSISGTGTFHFAGFDDTPGTFEFTSQTAGGVGPTFSFSATDIAVPEPTSMMLLGLGFLGSAGALRRRFAQKRAE
jgi:hypothetical protein